MKNNRFNNKVIKDRDVPAEVEKDSVNIGSGHESDYQGSNLEKLLHSALAARQDLKDFDGKVPGRAAKEWLEKLETLEGVWPDERLLKQARVLLKKRARIWFDALIGEEIIDYTTFKHYFKDEFMRNLSDEK